MSLPESEQRGRLLTIKDWKHQQSLPCLYRAMEEAGLSQEKLHIMKSLFLRRISRTNIKVFAERAQKTETTHMTELSAQKLEQLARARELAKAARERIRGLSDQEKAEHLRLKAEALQRRAEGKASRLAKKELPSTQAQKSEDPEREEEPVVQPAEPDVVPVADDGPAPDPLPVPDPPPPVERAPTRRRKRRIIVEESSSDSGSSVEEEIVMSRGSRRARSAPASSHSHNKVLEPHAGQRQKQVEQPDESHMHMFQLRALGLI
eukprot:scaffold16138_cov106-Isochrysis_galbana.AAC.3